jgi:hypothetical protein
VRKSLYFCRADKLEDPYEGEWPQATVEAYRKMLESLLPAEQAEQIMRLKELSVAFTKTTVFVNCWHINPNESAAMWKLYATNHEGIAIKTTVKRLCDSLNNWPRPIYIGEVAYQPSINTAFAFSSFLYKRVSFEHEKELRAVAWLPGMFGDVPVLKGENLQAYAERLRPCFDGYIPVDLDILIDEIFVAPMSPPYYGEVVESIVEKYGLGSKKPKRSKLYTLK